MVDKTIIKNVRPKYPELMREGASSTWLDEYNKLQTLKRDLYAAREGVRLLEAETSKQQQHLEKLSEFFDIEYGTKEVKEINNYIGMAVINPTDRRN